MPEYSTRRPGILASLFLLTAMGLAFEVSLTRLFSFLFIQSYVYIIISLSVSGIGLGALLMFYVPGNRGPGLLGWLLFAPAVLLLLLFLVSGLAGGIVASLAVTFGIYATIGAVQVYIFRESGIPPGRLYAADLLGAAGGSVLAFFLLNLAGAVDGVTIVVALMALAMTGVYASFTGARLRSALSGALVIIFALGVLLLPFTDRLMPDEELRKELTTMLEDPEAEGRITESRWSAFGRVDLVETNNPLFRTMFIDGGAGTKMVRMENGQVSRSVARTLLLQYMGGVPLLVVDQDRRQEAVVVGSGGGIDVVTLLVAGFENIDAVEINPDFIDIVREQADYTGGIYNDHERVTVHEAEGRSFLRQREKRYDLVLMGLPIIKSVRNFGNHALTENYLFTHNAFTEYRRAMRDEGMMIVVAHYRNELLRLVSNALKSYQEDGIAIEEAMEHIVTIGDPLNPTLVLKQTPFTEQERRGFRTILETIPTRGQLNFVPGIRPAEYQNYQVNPELAAMAAGDLDLQGLAARADEDVSWISDNSPFFYQLSPGLPREMTIVGLAVLVLVVLFTVLFAVSGLGPQRRARQSGTARQGSVGATALRFAAFGLIGIGYIVVEIAVLQRFIVFWQHQTLALAVVLSVILVSSGLGSLLSARLRRSGTLALILGAVSLLLLASVWFLRPLLLELEGAGPGIKVLVTVAFTAPIFLPLGMPFPTLLRSSSPRSYPWMIGINSIATLAGGVLTMILALESGYNLVMYTGLLAYVGVIIVLSVGRAFGRPVVTLPAGE